MDAREWYEKHGVTPDAEGWLDGVPQCHKLPVDSGKWIANIAANMQLEVANAQPRAYTPRTMVMVCGGVTARNFIEDIRAKALSPDYDVFCSNKTGEWLLQNGIVPQYHFILDSKKSKVKDLALIHPDVTYLLAVNCDPAVFGAVKHRKVLRFFCPSNIGKDGQKDDLDWQEVKKYLKAPMLAVCGGTMAGVRALNIADAFGYRKLEYYGFDACLASETEHYAYDKTHNEAILTVRSEDGREFLSTHVFADQVRQIQETRLLFPWVRITVHGDSFMSHMLRLDDAKRARKHALRITPEYLQLQRRMHQAGNYGISGHKHAKTVHALASQLSLKYGAVSVLDYGCGQCSLKKAFDSLPPVVGIEWREYDACILGKDAEPEPADLVICSDVMEHIEKDCVLNVLDHIESLAGKLAFFWIATEPAIKTLPDGRNAHICLKPPEWWQRQINARFLVSESGKYDGAVAFVGQALEAVKSEYVEKPISPSVAPSLVTEVKSGELAAKFWTVNRATKWRAETLLTKEPVTIEWINRMLPGEHFLDIGANVGGYSIWAGCRGLNVIAFEPAAQNYELLCQNIELNDLGGKVVAYCAALSDRMRLDRLYLATQDQGGSCNTFGEGVGPDLKPRQTAHVQGCIGLKLDDLVDSGQVPQPNHIKIDVDGLEHKVILGARKTVQKAKSILIEVNENLEPHHGMIQFLRAAGFDYQPHQVDQARRQSGAFKGCAEYLFTRDQDEIDLLIGRIMAATVETDPFPHLYLDQAFSGDFYENLLRHLDVSYQPISEARSVKGYPEREVHVPLNGFWGGIDKTLRDGRLKSAICAKFGRYDPAFKDETLLIRDSTGYQLGPHTDTMKKVISALFYLPQDGSMRNAGTSLYKPKISGFVCDGSKHHPAQNFNLVRTMPYLPNRFFAFAKSENSFHGVEPFQRNGVRNILLYDIRR